MSSKFVFASSWMLSSPQLKPLGTLLRQQGMERQLRRRGCLHIITNTLVIYRSEWKKGRSQKFIHCSTS